ncbi:BON domain-containing protein [Vitiosangium sp. GDMCC 1.1324]|uniref:BON domain-containing protein n=1 Tax=Vitiosangium sp. (strain GDMCC 1.1324) TaxID=2138576 RepID=UPI000D34EDDC|nr:BON domain-containing protein [Vitiosangium sp. GDMCC 1.1324]PTL76658.1 transporter [Vitiosangium sp. GDMCC 1.1324]
MTTPHPNLDSIRDAMEHHPNIHLTPRPVRMSLDTGDVLVLEGEVEDVASKKLLLEVAAATPGLSGIVDRLHVAPARPMSDAEVRQHVVDTLLDEPALRDCGVRVRDGGQVRVLRPTAPGVRGCLEVRVAEGIVTLDGDINSLAAKRLAGVLAWWVPGTRDVVNGLGVEPPERDNAEELAEAVHVVLEKDPFIDAAEIAVDTWGRTVTLRGIVHAEEQRRMAENDAWFVFGVDKVENQLTVLTP